MKSNFLSSTEINNHAAICSSLQYSRPLQY